MVAARLLARVSRKCVAAVAVSGSRWRRRRSPWSRPPLPALRSGFGFSSSSPQQNDKEVNQCKDQEGAAHASNGEASNADSSLSGSVEDLDLTEDLVKLVLEKDELLNSKDDEIKDMKDKVLRRYAEMENVIARTKRESENSKKYAIQNFSKSLLDNADSLSRASSVVKESFRKIDTSEESAGAAPLLKTLLEGVDMTDKQLGEVFKKCGIEKFDPLNEKFDPDRHCAIFQIPESSKPSGTVASVVKVGYMLYDRVLRPAEVGVTEGGPTEEEEWPKQKSNGDYISCYFSEPKTEGIVIPLAIIFHQSFRHRNK